MRNKFFTSFTIYAISGLLTRSISLFMTPLYLQFMSPQEYGIFGVLNSFMNISSIIISLGLRQLLALHYFHTQGNSRKELINEILATYLLIATPIILVGMYNAQTISNFLFAQPVSYTLIEVALLTIYQWFFVDLAYQLMQYTNRALTLMIIQITVAAINATLSLLFVAYFGWGAAGILSAQLIGLTVATLCCFIGYCIKKLHHTLYLPAQQVILYHLKRSLPLMPSMLFTWLITYGDRIMLSRMSTLYAVGIYSVADAFGLLFYLLITYPWIGAYQPALMKKYAQSTKDQLITVEQHNQKIMWYSILFLFSALCIGYILLMPLTKIIIPLSYHAAIPLIFAIVSSQILLLATNFSLCLIQFKKHTTFLAFAWCIPAALKIVLNLILIPVWDLQGCVTATVIAYATYFLITYFYNRFQITKLA